MKSWVSPAVIVAVKRVQAVVDKTVEALALFRKNRSANQSTGLRVGLKGRARTLSHLIAAVRELLVRTFVRRGRFERRQD